MESIDGFLETSRSSGLFEVIVLVGHLLPAQCLSDPNLKPGESKSRNPVMDEQQRTSRAMQ